MPEEPFVPGIDPRLKVWLKLRAESHQSKLKGTNVEVAPSDIRYKYHTFWLNSAANSDLGDKNYFENKPTSLECFKKMLEAKDLVPKEEILKNAISHRGLRFLKIALEAGCHVNSTFEPLSRTMLHEASRLCDVSKVLYLLNAGADVSKFDSRGYSPLHLALKCEEDEAGLKIVELLIQHGSYVNAADNQGRTPLHYACILRNWTLIRKLLRSSAEVYCLDHSHLLPVDYLKDQVFINS